MAKKISQAVINITQINTVDNMHIVRFMECGENQFSVAAGEGSEDYFEEYCTRLIINKDALKAACGLIKKKMKVLDENGKSVASKSGAKVVASLAIEIPDSRKTNNNYAKIIVGNETVNIFAFDRYHKSLNEELDLTFHKETLIEAIESL